MSAGEGCRLADGRTMRAGEAWVYRGATGAPKVHVLVREAPRPRSPGFESGREFVTLGGVCLGFDSVLTGPAGRWGKLPASADLLSRVAAVVGQATVLTWGFSLATLVDKLRPYTDEGSRRLRAELEALVEPEREEEPRGAGGGLFALVALGPVDAWTKPKFLRSFLDEVWIALDCLALLALVFVAFAAYCAWLDRRDRERARRRREEDR